MQKNIILTGGYGAIGGAMAKTLAVKRHRLFILGRRKDVLHDFCHKLSAESDNQDVYPIAIDLSEGTEIRSLAAGWDKPLDVLINNAVTAPPVWTGNSDGTEMQFAVNIMSYFLMMKYFRPFLQQSQDARIVNVASHWAGDLDLEDMEFRKRPYHNDAAYRQSKQAIRMLTVAFAEQFKRFAIAVNSCHPGFVSSKLTRDLGLGGHESAEQAAQTPLYLALSEEPKGSSGKYYEYMRTIPCVFSKDHEKITSLYQICRNYYDQYVKGRQNLDELNALG